MNPFFQALESGYNAEEILGYLSKALPSFVKPISKAKSLGYPAKQILGFLSKNFETENRRGMSESERHAVNRRADAERTKFGLKIGIAAAASPIAARVIGSAMSRALPTGLIQNNVPQANENNISGEIQHQQQQSLQPQIGTSPTVQQSQNISSQPPVNQPNIPQPTELEQPKEIPTTLQSREDVLWDALQRGKTKGPDDATSGMLKLAKQMMTTGQINKKEDFDRFSQIFTEKMSQTKSLPKALRETGNEYSKPKKMSQLEAPIEALETQEMPIEEPSIEPKEIIKPEPIKIEPNSIVATPEGIGEVKAIRNGKAIVEVDGKKHQVNEDELITSPLPEKDLADLYDEVISGIEKVTGQQVSRNVEWAGYDPKTGELAYKPHGGDRLYVYDDISPEDAEQLISLLTQRKTTGENFIGAWEKGTTSPIGAAMHKLIMKLQSERGGKGNEYKNRYETLYDALEPAKRASKRKYAEFKKKTKKPKSP
jgi:hypothetical protein